MIKDTKFPIIDYQTSITPQYRNFPGPHNYSSLDTLFELRKMSNGRIKTGTSELADFLKSSKPEDFGSPTVTGSVDDLSLSGSSHQKKHRFLRSLTPHGGAEKSRTQSPLPPHVTPKLTSKGSHYLQIQVDYGNIGHQTRQPFSEITTNAVSHPTLSTFNSNPGKGITQSDVAGITQLTQSHMSLSPPPWSPLELKLSAVDGMGAYQNPLRTDTEPTKTQRRTPVLPALKTDFGRPQARIPQIQHHIPRTLHTPTREIERGDQTSLGSVDTGSSPAPQGSPKGSNHSHAPPKIPIHPSGTNDHMAPQFDHTQLREILKPGPPPSRALPALPEIHDSSTLSGRSAHPHQVALRSGPLLPPSPIEKYETHFNDCNRREDRVNGRKAKDMKFVQQRKLQEVIRLLDTDAEAKGRTCHALPTESPVSPVSATGLPAKMRGPQTPPVSDPNSTTTTGSTSGPHRSNRLQLFIHDAPTLPCSPGPLLHPTVSVRNGVKSSQANLQAIPEENLRGLLEEAMARQTELEDRIESMEHKHMALEQALITLLQRTSPHRNESNSIEDLLADFHISHPCRGQSGGFPLERGPSQMDQ